MSDGAAGPVLVFGLGHPDRGDDAVGPLVAAALAAQSAAGDRAAAGPALRVERGSEPVALLGLLAAGSRLVLVDAVRTGRPAGTVLRRDLDADPLPATGAPGSGHLLGLDQVLGLARCTGRLARAWLVGVEGAGFGLGDPADPAVLAAVPAAAAAVLELAGQVARP